MTDTAAETMIAGLNPEQAAAVCHEGPGPLLVSAGPGTGKTEVITRRIAYMAHVGGFDPAAMLAITFTNRAAGTMRKRVRPHLGPSADSLWALTFHSACSRMLREHLDDIGHPRGFYIADTPESLDLCKEVIDVMGLPPALYRHRDMLAEIASLKHQGITPEMAQESADTHVKGKIAEVYAAYQESLRRRAAMDYDDLINRTVFLLRDNPDILRKWQERFDVVLVDEYQDTNIAQNDLVVMLSRSHENLTAVGDMDQAIYGWRGASPEHLIGLPDVYPATTVIHLTRNYRSTQMILDAAARLIRHNRQRLAGPEPLTTDRGHGLKVETSRADDENAEAAQIARRIQGLSDNGVPLGEIAVLYRTNAMSRAVEDQLLAADLPYQVVKGTRFYERAEIKDCLAYLRAAYGEADDGSIRRVINKPGRGVGPAAVDMIASHAAEIEVSLLEAARDYADIGLPRSAQEGVKRFLRVLDMAEDPADGMGAALRSLLDRADYWISLDSQDRVDNVEQLLVLAAQHTTAADLIHHVALMDDSDDLEEATDRVHLMTLHAAKGLEYRAVFLIGASEGTLPHFRSSSDTDALEEERRLAYVGATRAKDLLIISRPDSRYTAKGKLMSTRPSRFLREMSDFRAVTC